MTRRILLIIGASIISLRALAFDPVVPPGVSVGTRSLEQLTAVWWQWAMGSPEESNPIRDRTGADCAVGQSGGVWFLAGGFGSSKIRRTCVIPAGKSLFFPLVNSAYYPQRDNASYTCDDARREAALRNDAAINLFAELNGVPIRDLKMRRVSTKNCFNIFERSPEKNKAYRGSPTATDGYWLLVSPLPIGKHTLKFGGAYARNSTPLGEMIQDIEYEIEIKRAEP